MTTTQEYRFEMLMPDPMKVGSHKAAQQDAAARGSLRVNVSDYVRALIADDLNRRYGPAWLEFKTEQEVTDDSK